jgi:bifunctional oligoribonuclease and PAP phosphatase NrnA
MQNQSNISLFSQKVTDSQHIVIIPHQNPDGDAMGSSLALHHIFAQLGKQVSVILPNEAPSYLSWMPGWEIPIDWTKNQQQAQKIVDKCDLLIMVDFNTPKRVKDLETAMMQCNAFKVMIDHHPFPDVESANLIFSDTSVSSTCELAFQIITACGFTPMVRTESATCFYTGLITDTGALSHNSSRPETYQTVAELMRYGIDKDRIHQLLFHSNSYNRMRLLGYMLCEKMKLLPHLRAATITLSETELAMFDHQPGDTEGFVNYPLGIEGIDISGFFMEKDGKVKISLRSRGNYAVNKLSEQHFNGGGHLNAAGGESSQSLAEAVNTFTAAIPSILTGQQD